MQRHVAMKTLVSLFLLPCLIILYWVAPYIDKAFMFMFTVIDLTMYVYSIFEGLKVDAF
ncbi:hypothetical protein EDC94DRAFT_624602 [Helicostylum pulchrum]|nr:hypothetical protein EDC94DRAFT_624602 [Helicostylum pulchrum]